MHVSKNRIRRAFLWILRVKAGSQFEGVLARASSSITARQLVAEELDDERWLGEGVDVCQALEGGEDGIVLRAAVIPGASAHAANGKSVFDRLEASEPEPEPLELCEVPDAEPELHARCAGEGCDSPKCDDGWLRTEELVAKD